MRTRIKICGITSAEDAQVAVRAGADALGFVFYPDSPRYIQPAQAAHIMATLPPFISKVGLFVNTKQHDIDAIVAQCQLDVVQLHGDESPEDCAKQRKPVIKALPIASQEDLSRVEAYDCTVLLDAKAPSGVYGGVGKAFDWSLLSGLTVDKPLILAGGLSPSNISDALALFDWYAVDVSSGVELDKGLKDHRKVQDFCRKVHQYNGKVESS